MRPAWIANLVDRVRREHYRFAGIHLDSIYFLKQASFTTFKKSVFFTAVGNSYHTPKTVIMNGRIAVGWLGEADNEKVG